MSLLEEAIEVMADVRGALHVDEIAQKVMAKFAYGLTTKEVLAKKLASVLSSNVKKGRGKAVFAKVRNKDGGWRKGIYRLKEKPVVKLEATEAPVVTNQFTGKAGEFAVMSELLFYGFNVSSMTVDDGLDVVASKGSKYFHIQVKTANATPGGVSGFTVKKKSFDSKDSYQTFYVLVIRERKGGRYLNDHLVMPSSRVRQLLNIGVIRDGNGLTLRIQRDQRGRYLLNNREDVTDSVNAFSLFT